jgi:hypothetical protein
MAQPSPNIFTVSLSGADNIGKTSLLSLFPRNWPLVHSKSLDLYSDEVAEMLRVRSWFGTAEIEDHVFPKDACSDETFVVNLATACHKRLQVLSQSASGGSCPQQTLTIDGRQYQVPGITLDRGGQMYKAVCIARIAVLRQIDIAEAEARVEKILNDNHITFPSEVVSILLRLDDTIERRVEWTLHKEQRSVSTLYRRYQHALQLALDRQTSQGVYAAVIDRPSNEPLIETLTRVTSVLQGITGSSYTWRPLLANLKAVVAYGGLSECGKSSMCNATVKRAGAEGFRIKIAYLCELASARLGINVYTLPDEAQALEIVHELDLFVRWHRWLKIVTLDSLHRDVLTKRLGELIGNAVIGIGPRPGALPTSKHVKLLVVYIDTPLHLRISRTEAEGKVFDLAKDDLKRLRGADKVEAVSDLVVINDGPFEETFRKVWVTVEKYGADI